MPLNPYLYLRNFKSIPKSELTHTQQKIAIRNFYNILNDYEKQLRELLSIYVKLHYTALPFIKQNKLHHSAAFKPAQKKLDELDLILKNLYDKPTMQYILQELNILPKKDYFDDVEKDDNLT